MSENTNETITAPKVPGMSIHDFAADAAENMDKAIAGEKPPCTSGYILLAFADKGDTITLKTYGKAIHMANAMANAIQYTKNGGQILDKTLDELERRLGKPAPKPEQQNTQVINN